MVPSQIFSFWCWIKQRNLGKSLITTKHLLIATWPKHRAETTSRWQTPGTAAGTGGEALHLQPNLHVWHPWAPPHSPQEELNWMTPKNPFYQCLCSPLWWCSTSRIPFINPKRCTPKIWGWPLQNEAGENRNPKAKLNSPSIGVHENFYTKCVTNPPVTAGSQLRFWTSLPSEGLQELSLKSPS